MQWFTGSIPEAIGESKRKGLVFIVYIEGMFCQWECNVIAFIFVLQFIIQLFRFLPTLFNLFMF